MSIEADNLAIERKINALKLQAKSAEHDRAEYLYGFCAGLSVRRYQSDFQEALRTYRMYRRAEDGTPRYRGYYDGFYHKDLRMEEATQANG